MSLARHEDDWRSLGACLSADPDLFFPISARGSSAAQVNRAKSICAGCLVPAECLNYAFANAGIQGIWGGTTEDERQKLRRRDAATVQRPASPAGRARSGTPPRSGTRTRSGTQPRPSTQTAAGKRHQAA